MLASTRYLAHAIFAKLFICLCLAQPAAADPEGQNGEPAEVGGSGKSSDILFSNARDFFALSNRNDHKSSSVRQLPHDLWNDQKRIWTSPFHLKESDFRWLLPLAATTGVLIGTDHHIMTLIHSDATNRYRSSLISDGGLALFAGAAAMSYGFGRITHDEHSHETGILAAEAAADSFFAVEALKIISSRQGPETNSGNGLFEHTSPLESSFPSEHAAFAWSVAAIFAREYPGTAMQWGAYGLASLVSLSRVTAEKHFPSDVLIGAAAGYLMGRFVYNAHHDDSMTDRTGSTPRYVNDSTPALTGVERKERDKPTGSVYVPLDSWTYPALRRLAALGYIPDQVSDSAPWTRLECRHQVEEAENIATNREMRTAQASINEEALRLIADLKAEFNRESEGGNVLRLESIYTRITDIEGPPLRDSYHFGQTINDDYGRPFGEGVNNITGFSASGASGVFSVYMRGEYQEAPGAAAYSLGVRQSIANTDEIPLPAARPISSTSRFEPLEMYAGVQLGFENITFGKQSLWWGPDEDSAFTFSNNAAPFYMLRMAQTRPLVLPGLFSLLGKIRTEIVFGKLSGNSWPARPFINAQKISFDLTDNFELGFTRGAIFGGVGHPLTLGTLEASLFSVNSADFGPYGSRDLPGTRFSSFDFRWRVPGLRKYVTVYSDSYGRDEPSPIDNPKRAPWAPGLYLSHLPRLPRFDFRFETFATWLYRKDQGGDFIYWDNQYRDAGTNDGDLLGSWVGRDSRAYTADVAYWFSGKSKLQAQYRQIKAGNNFLPGGGTQSDVSVTAQWSMTPEWMVTASCQYERYFIPILGGPRRDITGSLQVVFTPRHWQWRL
jgi:membrane-associated phospholipid phosphatase